MASPSKSVDLRSSRSPELARELPATASSGVVEGGPTQNRGELNVISAFEPGPSSIDLAAQAHLDPRVARALCASPRLEDTCARVSSRSSEFVGEIADAVYYASLDAGLPLQEFPTLYSDAVRFALDPRVRQAAKGVPGPEPRPLLDQGRVQEGENGSPKWLEAPKWVALKLMKVASAPAPGTGRPEALEKPFRSGEVVRVYMGLNSEDPEFLRAGALSHAERILGRQKARAMIAQQGEAAAVVSSSFAHQDKKRVTFVSTSLSEAVAESYAQGRHGHVLVADIPASAGFFVNDPQLWAHTPFRHVGNPEHRLREFVVPEIRPEWVVDIRQTRYDRSDIVAERHVEGSRQMMRTFLPTVWALVTAPWRAALVAVGLGS